MKSATMKIRQRNNFRSNFARDKFMYLLLLPSLLSTLIFAYLTMPGVILAFKDLDVSYSENVFIGIFTSPWNGLDNVMRIFSTEGFMKALTNTLTLSFIGLFGLCWTPIILAILFNEIKNAAFKRFSQTVSYLPHFLSTITIVGIVMSLYSYYGPVNDIFTFLTGNDRQLFLANPGFFVPNYILISAWSGTGWGTILYLANISGIDAQLFEAAKMDGANRFQQIWHIIMPSIMGVLVILWIMSMGGIFSVSFELVYGLQNPLVDFETLDTLIYKTGFGSTGDYTGATAIGTIRGLIGMVLTLSVNWISKKVSGISFY